jgi:hypothetical protein
MSYGSISETCPTARPASVAEGEALDIEALLERIRDSAQRPRPAAGSGLADQGGPTMLDVLARLADRQVETEAALQRLAGRLRDVPGAAADRDELAQRFTELSACQERASSQASLLTDRVDRLAGDLGEARQAAERVRLLGRELAEVRHRLESLERYHAARAEAPAPAPPLGGLRRSLAALLARPRVDPAARV